MITYRMYNTNMEYHIDIFDNHLILLNQERKFLIDTGSPSSISNEGEIKIFGQTYRTSQNYPSLTIDELNKEIGYDLNALIGGDILKNHIFQIDFKNRLFTTWDSFPIEGINLEENIDIDLFMDIPIIEIFVKQNPIRSFLDTGAKISYLNKRHTKELDAVDNKEDFYPTFGRFNTPIYELPINFYDREIFLNFGVLPDALEASLSMANTKAIIGNDIFSHFSLIFHYANNKIYIKHL